MLRTRLLTFPLAALLAGLTLFAGPSRAEDLKSPLRNLELADGDCVVFLGDSITHQCLYTQYVEDYYYTRFPHLRIKFHNAGVGGARARDALDRFDRDVAAYKPKYVTVLLGMNDGSYQPYNENTFQTYHKDMRELVARIRETGAKPVLMTPTMFDSRAARIRDPKADAGKLEFYNSTLAYYGAWLREIAVENSDGFVDMYSLLNNLTLAARKSSPNFTMIKDAVHPDPPGQLVMAYALLNGLDSPAVVADIKIGLGLPQPAAEAKGGELSDLKTPGAAVEFTWTAAALPLVVPAEAESGARMLYLGHALSRESLTVTGLTEPAYELKIDHDPVGVYTAAHLARGVELEENPHTPQYKQAVEVARLNKQRNEGPNAQGKAGPVKQLRNEWSQMQQYYRLKRQAAADPNNADAAKQFEAQAKKVEGLEDRIATHEQDAKHIEEKIFEVNRPRPHDYRLDPVTVGTVPVQITLKGKPLAGAEVAFEGEGGRSAHGTTAADGRCQMGIGDSSRVVAVGQYRVTVRGDAVPEKYSNPDASGLRVSVVAGANQFAFELAN